MNASDEQIIEQQSIKRPLAWLIWGLAVSYVVYKFQTQSSYAVLNADIAESLSLTLLQVGELGAVYAITYAVMTIPAGGLLDRYGARMILSAGVAIVAAGALIFGLADSAAVIITGQALMGIGGAFGYPGLAYLTRYWFDIRHFGLVFGVAQTVAATANTLGQAAVGYLILVMAWQDIMLLEALAGFLLMIAFLMLVREPGDSTGEPVNSGAHPPFWAGLWRDLKVLSVRPLFWQVTLISGLTFGLMLGVGIIWGIKLLIFKGFEPTSASNINATIWFGFGAGALLVHVLSDYVRSFKLTCVIFLVCDLIALLLFILLSDISTGVAYMLFLSIGFFAGVSPMCYTMTTRFCEKARAGTAFGLLTCVSFVIGALLMPAPARLIEDFNVPVDMAAMIFPAALVLALILAVIKQETYHMVPAGQEARNL
ncbi:MAG: MFS transporter [Gammaproteobacteria bacterium]|nr:MFS transporter [Gammaproteobacteria bacterium]